MKEEAPKASSFLRYHTDNDNMNRKQIAAIAVAAASAFSAMAKDETVMTVNGVDVPRSEFEYLYHKNQQQQVDPQSLAEYAEMFKVYKLKVADALSLQAYLMKLKKQIFFS